MANGVVNFIINCFKKGNGAEEVKQDIDEAKKSAGQFAKGLETLGGAANVAGRTLRALLTGGLWEAGGRAIMYLWEKFKEWKEKSLEAAREVARELSEKFSNAAEFAEKKFKKLADSIADGAKRARELMSLGNKRGEVRTASEVADINAKMRKDIAGAGDESARAVIQAKAQAKIAKVRAEERVKRAEASEKEAEAEVSRAKQRIEAARSASGDAEWNQRAAEGAYDAAMRKGDDEAIKMSKETLRKANESLAAARKRVADEEAKLASARTAVTSAQLDRIKARTEADESVAAADFALAEAERKAKEAAEAKAAADKTAAEDEKFAWRKRQQELQERLNREQAEEEKSKRKAEKIRLGNQIEQAKGRAKDEVAGIDKQIKTLKGEIDQIVKMRERASKGMAADRKHHNGLFGEYQYQTNEKGVIDNFTDWERAQRYAGRAERDARTQQKRADAADKRMEDIGSLLRAGKYVSEGDRRRYNKWRQFREERDGEERRQKQIEALQKKRDEAIVKSEQHLAKLREQMKKLVEDGPLD